MGLYADVDIQDWGCATSTPYGYVQVDYGPAIDAFQETFMSVSESLVPVDTGYLKSTLSASSSGTLLIAEASAEYAEYVEYGTWKMAAQPYFEPAFQEACARAYSVAHSLYGQAMQEESEIVAGGIQSEAEGIAQGLIGENGWLMDMIARAIGQIIAGFIAFIISLFFDQDD